MLCLLEIPCLLEVLCILEVLDVFWLIEVGNCLAAQELIEFMF